MFLSEAKTLGKSGWISKYILSLWVWMVKFNVYSVSHLFVAIECMNT